MKTIHRNLPYGISLLLALLLVAFAVESTLAVSPQDDRATASVSGEIFMDSNLNAVREPLETGISGARIILLDAGGEILAESVSDEEGYYTFAGLDLATYKIQVLAPSGYVVAENGNLTIDVSEVTAPSILSTPLRHGLFVPMVNR